MHVGKMACFDDGRGGHVGEMACLVMACAELFLHV
jgi:hypothetical protein